MFKNIIGCAALAIIINAVGFMYFFDEIPLTLVEMPVLVQPVELPNVEPLYVPPTFDIDDPELVCLAENIFHEARNQSIHGQQAVGFVTMNRVKHASYPDSVCEVVYQPYQFSWTLTMPEINYDNIIELGAWEQAVTVAQEVMNKTVDNTMFGVTHYHATYVDPNWGKIVVATIDDHIFYRSRNF